MSAGTIELLFTERECEILHCLLRARLIELGDRFYRALTPFEQEELLDERQEIIALMEKVTAK